MQRSQLFCCSVGLLLLLHTILDISLNIVPLFIVFCFSEIKTKPGLFQGLLRKGISWLCLSSTVPSSF